MLHLEELIAYIGKQMMRGNKNLHTDSMRKNPDLSFFINFETDYVNDGNVFCYYQFNLLLISVMDNGKEYMFH